MSVQLTNTQQLRHALHKEYYIDHTIELQLLSAVLIENDIFDIENEYHTNAARKFANYFNRKWNLQIITSKENNYKKNAITKYIRWKYEPGARYPEDYVFHTIDRIYQYYFMNRDQVLFYINNDFIGHKNKLRKVENSLFCLLKCRHCQHPYIDYDDILEECNELHHHIVDQCNLDHIVELQILSNVLLSNGFTNIHTEAKFAKYFNEEWNFQIVEKQTNNRKGQNVTNWLNWLNSDNSYKLKNNIFKTIDDIFYCYDNHRNWVRNAIENDLSLTKREQTQYRNLENYLYNILKQ